MKKNGQQTKFFGLGRLFPYLRRSRTDLIIMCVLGIGVNIIKTVVPLFQKYALDVFVGRGTMDTLFPFVSAYLAFIAVLTVMDGYSTYLSFRAEVLIKKDMRDAAFEHIQKLSVSFFSRNSVGYIHSRVMSDVSSIGKMISWNMMDSICQLTYLLGAVIVMLSINAALTLGILIIIPAAGAVIVLFQKRLVRVNREIRRINSRITGDLKIVYN